MELYKKGSRGEVVRQIQKALHLYPDGIFGVITEEAVKAFQQKNGITPVDGIVGPKTFAKLIPCRFKKSKRRIDYIVVHCTDTPEGRNNTVEDIRQWHTMKPPKGRGWSDIGYHYVIYLDGSIHEGRDVNLVGAHVEGYNTNSIGICYVGGKSKDMTQNKDTRTDRQKMALLSILVDLRKLYPYAKIVGHRDLDKKGKTCPNFDARQEYRHI